VLPALENNAVRKATFLMAVTSAQPKTSFSRPGAEDDLKTLPLLELKKKLESSPDGISQAEAAKRLIQYGPNEIEEKKQNVLLKILSSGAAPTQANLGLTAHSPPPPSRSFR
jgi:hypothetical protein